MIICIFYCRWTFYSYWMFLRCRTSDDDFGLLLEDDIEVSPYYYLWIKYALLAYHYDPQISLSELSSISLYTPRLVEVVKERHKWNAIEFCKHIHPNTSYLHQLPCSWGAVFFLQAMERVLRLMGKCLKLRSYVRWISLINLWKFC